jgi:hypothetical protein
MSATKSKISDVIRKVKPYLSLKGAGETIRNWSTTHERNIASETSVMDYLKRMRKKGVWANEGESAYTLGRIKRAHTVKKGK